MKRLFAALLVLTILLTGCSGSESSSMSDAAESSNSTYEYGYYESDSTSDGFGGGFQDIAIPDYRSPSGDIGIQLVYTVEMGLQTTAFPEGTRRLLQQVEEAGGFVRSTYVEGRSLYTPGTARCARYLLSIPTGELSGFLTDMEDTFNLLFLRQESEELTRQHAARSNELEYLQTQEMELLAILERLDEADAQQRDAIQQELSEVRSRIGSVQISVKETDNSINYSTVAIELYEVLNLDGMFTGAKPLPFGDRLQEAAGNSVNRFMGICQGIIIWLTSVWPVLLVLFVLALLGKGIWRLIRGTRAGLAIKGWAAEAFGKKEAHAEQASDTDPK